MNETRHIPNNTLAFMALANEYCAAVENVVSDGRETFIDNMLRLLPRIYISASDLTANGEGWGTPGLPAALDEEHYDTIRANIATVMGEDDTYLDVFEEDMKFSDTPIATSVSEQLADLFQVLYNFVECVRESTDDVINEAVEAVRDDFDQYWSRVLCNALRAVNAVRHSDN